MVCNWILYSVGLDALKWQFAMPKMSKIAHYLFFEKCQKSRYFCGRILARRFMKYSMSESQDSWCKMMIPDNVYNICEYVYNILNPLFIKFVIYKIPESIDNIPNPLSNIHDHVHNILVHLYNISDPICSILIPWILCIIPYSTYSLGRNSGLPIWRIYWVRC